MKGKELKISSKPYLTEEHMATNVRCSTRVLVLIVQQQKII